jgi:hypothetical protein
MFPYRPHQKIMVDIVKKTLYIKVNNPVVSPATLTRSPFGPVPLQNLLPYYGLLRPCAPHRYSHPCGFFHFNFSIIIGTTGSHVPHKSLNQVRATFMPDAAHAVNRFPVDLS